jgi:UDP:flavonoid glycosyltransferase YjiC (YdhE family)
MKILITPLQVSHSGSKGHLHPAIELALAAKRRGHEVAILPLPSPLGVQDRMQLERLSILYIEPPQVADGILKSPEELSKLAVDPQKVHLAFSSFLLEPLATQVESVKKIIQDFQPDFLLFDLLAYAAPLAARSLGVREAGYCAGLKLIAPSFLLGTYIRVTHKLGDQRKDILKKLNMSGEFHYLEILSPNVNFVFTSPELVADHYELPPKTLLVGSIHPSIDRGENSSTEGLPEKDFILLSFGSVLDPADFFNITNAIIEAAAKLNLKVVISSKKLLVQKLPTHVYVRSYLPLPQLIPKAKVYIHHGGASSFTEATVAGACQLIIPLTTDQPIQAHFLQHSGAGLSLSPEQVNMQSILDVCQKLMSKKSSTKASEIANLLRGHSGAENAIKYLEKELL